MNPNNEVESLILQKFMEKEKKKKKLFYSSQSSFFFNDPISTIGQDH